MFAGIFPVDTTDFQKLDESIKKLTLNDASVSVHKETRYIIHFYIPFRLLVVDMNYCIQ